MELINILAAAVAAWVFGALWYGMLGKHWMDATGKNLKKLTHLTKNHSSSALFA